MMLVMVMSFMSCDNEEDTKRDARMEPIVPAMALFSRGGTFLCCCGPFQGTRCDVGDGRDGCHGDVGKT
jgi:hypothetical protein